MSAIETPRSFRQLLAQTLPAEFRKEVVETFVADKEAKAAVQESLRMVAALRKLRPQTIAQFGQAQRAQLFLGVLSQPDMETGAMHALQVWFLRKGRDLMVALLDAWKVPHENGELADDAVLPELDAETVRSAVASLTGVSAAAIDAYLGYNLLAAPAESWSKACGEVLSERLAG